MLKRLFKNSIIPAVTIGSIIEWYEIGLYIYWAFIIEEIFFDYTLPITETINFVAALSIGLIARPIGGYVFGQLGDHAGRKKAFTLTVLFISIPTFLIGTTQSYYHWSFFSTLFIGFMKFLQGIPAGGEIPGAICYLAEDANKRTKRYTCSFALVGPQLGLLLSLAQSLLLQEYLSPKMLMSWGWRLSFLTCGLLGILGYILRRRLHESYEYQHLKNNHKISKHPVRELFKKHANQVVIGFCISIFEVVGFCLLTIIPAIYFKKLFNISESHNLIINCSFLIACVILPPVIGKIADLYKKIPFLEISAIGCILLSYTYYAAIFNANFLQVLLIHSLLILLFSIQVALIPSVLSDLFPTSIRYTGIGFSFNICDGILWGLIPLLVNRLIQATHHVASFVIFLPVTAIIFLISYHFFKKSARVYV